MPGRRSSTYVQPIGDGFIPLVGCRALYGTSKLPCVITEVRDYRAKMADGSVDFETLSKRERAMLGDDWRNRYYEAIILLSDDSTILCSYKELVLVEPERTRLLKRSSTK